MNLNNLVNLFTVLTIVSCSTFDNKKDEIDVQYSYENISQAKADWPGLYQLKDSLVTLIAIVGKEGEDRVITQNFYYLGGSDTLWTNIIKRRSAESTPSKDTIINTFVAEPINLDTSKVVIYFMSGFNDEVVSIWNNDERVFNDKVDVFTTYIQLEKKSLKGLKIKLGEREGLIKLNKGYNFIELIKRDSVINCNYRYFMPIG